MTGGEEKLYWLEAGKPECLFLLTLLVQPWENYLVSDSPLNRIISGMIFNPESQVSKSIRTLFFFYKR